MVVVAGMIPAWVKIIDFTLLKGRLGPYNRFILKENVKQLTRFNSTW